MLSLRLLVELCLHIARTRMPTHRTKSGLENIDKDFGGLGFFPLPFILVCPKACGTFISSPLVIRAAPLHLHSFHFAVRLGVFLLWQVGFSCHGSCEIRSRREAISTGHQP